MTGPLPAWAATAAACEAIANWVDSELAGGTPPKWVAQVAAETLRHVAGELRAAHEGGKS